ncbi:MAG: hypothetical protein ACXVFK_09390 [Solirubrobacteraceae bacterium]
MGALDSVAADSVAADADVVTTFVTVGADLSMARAAAAMASTAANKAIGNHRFMSSLLGAGVIGWPSVPAAAGVQEEP